MASFWDAHPGPWKWDEQSGLLLDRNGGWVAWFGRGAWMHGALWRVMAQMPQLAAWARPAAAMLVEENPLLPDNATHLGQGLLKTLNLADDVPRARIGPRRPDILSVLEEVLKDAQHNHAGHKDACEFCQHTLPALRELHALMANAARAEVRIAAMANAEARIPA